MGSSLVVRLAEQTTAIDAEIANVESQITELFGQHHEEILLSMPGSGPWLPRGSWPTPAGISAHFEPGAASQRRRGRHRAPGLGPDQRQSPQARRYNRRLLRTCYPAALSSLKNSFASRTLDERKRAEPKSHKQALIALARRGINTPGPCSATAPPIRNPPLLSPLRRLDKSIEITGAGHGPSASAGRSEIFSASLNGRRCARAPSRRALGHAP